MSQGMDDKISQISNMLNSREAQDGIRRLLSSFNGPTEATPAQADSQTLEMTSPETHQDNPVQSQESDWINKIQGLLSQANSIQDSRVNLLRSVHPFLNQTRRGYCETCINILKVADVLRAVTNKNGRLF